MGDLATDTAIRPVAERTYEAELSPDWNMWGPNGGYLPAVVLRVGGAFIGPEWRPASLNCHFPGGCRVRDG
jgi:acyl-CoA thioesterase-2